MKETINTFFFLPRNSKKQNYSRRLKKKNWIFQKLWASLVGLWNIKPKPGLEFPFHSSATQLKPKLKLVEPGKYSQELFLGVSPTFEPKPSSPGHFLTITKSLNYTPSRYLHKVHPKKSLLRPRQRCQKQSYDTNRSHRWWIWDKGGERREKINFSRVKVVELFDETKTPKHFIVSGKWSETETKTRMGLFRSRKTSGFSLSRLKWNLPSVTARGRFLLSFSKLPTEL